MLLKELSWEALENVEGGNTGSKTPPPPRSGRPGAIISWIVRDVVIPEIIRIISQPRPEPTPPPQESGGGGGGGPAYLTP